MKETTDLKNDHNKFFPFLIIPIYIAVYIVNVSILNDYFMKTRCPPNAGFGCFMIGYTSLLNSLLIAPVLSLVLYFFARVNFKLFKYTTLIVFLLLVFYGVFFYLPSR